MAYRYNNTPDEFRALRSDLESRDISFSITNDIGGHSETRPLTKVYVDRKPLDLSLYEKLGFILVKWERPVFRRVK